MKKFLLLIFPSLLFFETPIAQNFVLWGLTAGGGISNSGVLFNLNTGNNAYNNLLDFAFPNHGISSTGYGPEGSLIQASNGLLYGMTPAGGPDGNGVIFSFSPCTNIYTVVYSFEDDSSSGTSAAGSLVQAANGLLYGMTLDGGANNYGVIFSFNPAANTYTNLYNFTGGSSSSLNPVGNLIQGANGLLYGLTPMGGANNDGALFSFNPANNAYTNLYNFGGASGIQPHGSLVQAANGLLYGMAANGGANNKGVLFSFNPANNAYTDLYNFAGGSNSGDDPYGNNLIQAANGLLYGMTREGGTGGYGVIFSFNPANNAYTNLYSLSADSGYQPFGSLVQAGNGLLYGMTQYGAAYGYGSVFSFNPDSNIFTNLYSFAQNSNSGANPYYTSLLALSPSAGQIIYDTLNRTICHGDTAWLGGHAYTQNGVYTDTFTRSGGCDSIVTLNLSLSNHQGTPVSITANSDSICSGDSTQICATPGFVAYAWSPVVEGDSGSPDCVFGQQPGTYDVTATDINGCTTQSNSISIGLRQSPAVTISANFDTICAGSSAQICSNGNFAIYAWNNNAGSSCIEAQNPSVYTLTVTDSHGCTAQSNSLIIYGGQAPTATVSANKDTICPGDSAQLCATGNFSQYIWSNHAQTLCMETQTPGTYFLRAASANGCSVQSNSVIISAGQAPSVTISANADSICSGDSAQICATQGFASYAWNPAIGGATGNCIQVHSPGAYSVAVSGNSGCTAQSNPISIAVLQRPTINIAATSDSICTGDSARLCATPGFVMYVWSPPAAAGQGACIESFNTGTYNVTVTDNHNCTAQSNTVNITVGNTLSVAIAATADSICTGDTAKICASFGFATYAWNAATGGTTGNCINTASAGNYYVSVSDNSGCSAQSNTIVITALQAPTAIVTANPPSLCPGSSAQICATAGYATYRWTYNNNNSNCIAVQRADNYAVTVTDNNGCTTASNPISISLQSAPPVTITAQPENICPGDSSQICAPQGLEAYLWSTNATGNCIHTASAGNYNLTVTDNNGCTALSNHITINIYPKPSVTIASGLDTICPGDSTKICAPSTLTFTTYLWNPPAAAGQGACIEAQNAGDYYVTVTDNVGCTAESNHINITALPSPQVSISRIGDTLIANNAIGCQWYFNDAIIQGATRNTYVARISGTYTVSVTDSDGCSGFSSPIVFTGIADISGDDNFIIYPNPLAVGSWQLSVGNKYIGAQVEILSVDGRLVYKSEIKTIHSEIEAPFSGGVYLLRIISGTSIVARKLVKL